MDARHSGLLVASALRFIKAIKRKKNELTYSYRIKHAHGHYIWREDHARYIYDASGTYLGAYVSCRDVTDRKNIEDKLIVLGRALEASPATIVITDAAGTIQYVNPKFTSVTGYSSKEAIGKNPRLLKSGKTDAKVYDDMWRTLSSGKDWKGCFINRKKNGEIYYESATIAPVKNHKGEVTNYIAIKEDVIEKLISQALKIIQSCQSRSFCLP
jgi:PAS domain S-box-containing protein